MLREGLGGLASLPAIVAKAAAVPEGVTRDYQNALVQGSIEPAGFWQMVAVDTMVDTCTQAGAACCSSQRRMR